MSKPGNNKGTKNFTNKLSEEDVITIFKSSLTQSVLAKQFGVSQSTINHIKNQRTWEWLTNGIEK